MNYYEAFALVAIIIGTYLLIGILMYFKGLKVGIKDMVEMYTKAHANLWTPIDECLPEEDVRVIVAIKHDHSYTQIDTDRILHGQWVRWEGSITHWTELPELPKESEDLQ